jgi:hypothetical protein
MGVHTELDLADATRNQQLLSGPRHPHRDVGLAAQQILYPVSLLSG